MLTWQIAGIFFGLGYMAGMLVALALMWAHDR
jgi:hypothetical protein